MDEHTPTNEQPPTVDASVGVDEWAKIEVEHQHIRQSVRIPMRADLVDELARLEVLAAREQATDRVENRDPVAPGIATQIRELEAQMIASEVQFTFQALGRRDYAKLLADNPPTDEQKREADEDDRTLQWNPDTFPPQLLAASCIAPAGATVERFTDIWENWSEGQVSQLWNTCLTTNMAGAGAGPKSQIASAILNGSVKS